MTHNINSTYIHRMLVTSILSMKYLGRNTSMVSFFFFSFFLEGISTFRFFNGARVSLGYLLRCFSSETTMEKENYSLRSNSQSRFERGKSFENKNRSINLINGY